MIFPIVGVAKYFDDWGAPRGQGRHAGNDILTTWKSAAVAAEDGTIKFWTTSARAEIGRASCRERVCYPV